ncbi:MAG: hypothetical protein ACM3O7_04185 [Acidobacteriota bacterium]
MSSVATQRPRRRGPASSNEDLMVVDQEPARTRAVCFDNKGLVVDDTVSWSGEGAAVTFRSDPLPTTPSYRLTSRRIAADRVAMSFEVTPPGQPDAFTTYIQATARRK